MSFNNLFTAGDDPRRHQQTQNTLGYAQNPQNVTTGPPQMQFAGAPAQNTYVPGQPMSMLTYSQYQQPQIAAPQMWQYATPTPSIPQQNSGMMPWQGATLPQLMPQQAMNHMVGYAPQSVPQHTVNPTIGNLPQQAQPQIVEHHHYHHVNVTGANTNINMPMGRGFVPDNQNAPALSTWPVQPPIPNNNTALGSSNVAMSQNSPALSTWPVQLANTNTALGSSNVVMFQNSPVVLSDADMLALRSRITELKEDVVETAASPPLFNENVPGNSFRNIATDRSSVQPSNVSTPRPTTAESSRRRQGKAGRAPRIQSGNTAQIVPQQSTNQEQQGYRPQSNTTTQSSESGPVESASVQGAITQTQAGQTGHPAALHGNARKRRTRPRPRFQNLLNTMSSAQESAFTNQPATESLSNPTTQTIVDSDNETDIVTRQVIDSDSEDEAGFSKGFGAAASGHLDKYTMSGILGLSIKDVASEAGSNITKLAQNGKLLDNDNETEEETEHHTDLDDTPQPHQVGDSQSSTCAIAQWLRT